MIERRSLLVGVTVASVGAITGCKAEACSPVLPPNAAETRELAKVTRLIINAWVEGDRKRLEASVLTKTEREQGGWDGDPAPVFDRLFTDRSAGYSIRALEVFGRNVIAEVHENPENGIGADCSGLPTAWLLQFEFEPFSRKLARLVELSRYYDEAKGNG